MTRSETIIRAVIAALQGVENLPEVRRNVAFDIVLESFIDRTSDEQLAALIVRDGDIVRLGRDLGDAPVYELQAEIDIEWLVCGREGDDLDAAFDAGLERIGTAFDADNTLGGAATLAEFDEPPVKSWDEAGARLVKSALLQAKVTFHSNLPW